MTGADGIRCFTVAAVIQTGAYRLHVRVAGRCNSGRPAKAGQDDQYQRDDHSHGEIIYQRLSDLQITMMCRPAAMDSTQMGLSCRLMRTRQVFSALSDMRRI